MDSSIFKKAGELLSRKSKYRHWQAAVAVLSVAVIGTTAIVLSQPAQTMTKEAYCGMEEHAHGGDCYERVLICGYEEDTEGEATESSAAAEESGEEASRSSGEQTPEKEASASAEESGEEASQPSEEQVPEREAHQHDDSCYAEYVVLSCGEGEAPLHQLGCYAGAGMLICGQEESADHIHADGCYGAVPVKVLACGQEESETHTHSEDGEDSCYIIVGAKALVCGMEESEEHAHTEECYELIPGESFQCMEGHIHTESCYPQETEPALICGLEEQEAHTHIEECYTVTEKEELICGQEASEEHEHTAECYNIIEEKELTCGKEETEGHTHTEQCYSQDEEKTPVCGREEKEVPPADAHVHTIACCGTERKLICGKEEYIPEESPEPASEEAESTAAPEASAEPGDAPESADSQESASPESAGSGEAGDETVSAGSSTEPESAEAGEENGSEADKAAEAGNSSEEGSEADSTEESTESGEGSSVPAEEGKHVHTDACYEMALVCGLEEHAHTDECHRVPYCGIQAHHHMAACYDEEGNVICGLEEHTHEENCYKEPHCGITAHTHTEECYDENGEIVCGMEEHAHGDECFVEESNYTGPFHCQEKIHQHSADCYDEENNLICGLADYVVHAHNDSCYDEDGELICPLPEIEEHAHSAQCYDIPGEGEEAQLACGKEEAKLHTHTEDCCDEEGKLTCGMLQAEEHVHSEACLTATEEAHVHTENCYDEAGNLTCGYEEAHTHTEGCYDEEGKLICGFGEETEELPYYCDESIHEHSEECYDENRNLICGKADFMAHVHREDCYNKAGELVCPLPEIEAHIHSAACYSEANGQLEAELICGKTEDIKLHTHTEECYDADGSLICGKLEILEHVHGEACHVKPEAVEDITYYCQEMVHEHSEDCYNENGELICGEADYAVHTHTEKCYGADEKLICPLPEVEVHTHTEECYDENGQIICGKEEAQLHTHTEECYDENGAMICGQVEVLEHIHSKDCEVSHKPITKTFQGGNFVVTATYKPEANLPEEAELIAEQITAESNEEHYAMRQAEYQEALGDDKATMRALLKIGFYVNGEEVEPESPVTITVQFLDENGLAEGKPITVIHFADEGTELLEGSKVEDGSTTFEMNSFSEIAVGYGVENVKVPVNEELKYETDEFQVTFKIEGEVRVPVGDTKLQEEEGAEGETAVPGDSTEGEVAQGEENTVDNPEGEAQTGEGGVSVSIENSNLEKKLEFRVDPVNENAEEYAKAVAAVYADGTVKREDETKIGDGIQQKDETNAADGIQTEDGSQPEEETDAGEDIEAEGPEIDMDGDQLFLQVLSYSIMYDGQKLDLSDCTVTAEVKPSEALVEYAETAIDPMTLELEGEEHAANDVEIKPEVVITAVELAKDEAEVEIADAMVVGYETMATPMLLTLRSDSDEGVVAFSGTSQANPSFTVEFYARIDRFITSNTQTEGYLPVIDTKGGKLPQNGGTTTKGGEIEKKYIKIENSMVSTNEELTEIYSSGNYEYVSAPGLVYFNKIAKNESYELNEIQVTRKNGNGSETYSCIDENGNKKEWHFTNKKSTSDEYPEEFILITDDATIRLIYKVNDYTVSNGASFYDYDVSDGKVYTYNETTKKLTEKSRGEVTSHNSGEVWYMYTMRQGINSNLTNQTFGFGNSESSLKTTMGEIVGNRANADNADYGSATFGLVTGLEDGKIQYASNVVAPALFNDQSENETVKGKETYAGDLVFKQRGDTYTLTAAEVKENGIKVSEVRELDTFRQQWNWNNTRYFQANDFYPLDYVHTAGTGGHDLLFGAPDTKVLKNYSMTKNGKLDGEPDSPLDAPGSDDEKNHNHYFGMHYTVSFNLVEDYVGPLEYLFYGDDDMWVFLSGSGTKAGTNEETGEVIRVPSSSHNGTLICDIGGVHSAIGEYVDLWDYIEKGTEGKYTLTFFYTERGASGSTCWMQFTLPSVSFATTEQDTGMLRIEKEVTGPVTSEEFGFEVKFQDNSGNDLKHDYSYTKYDDRLKSDENPKGIVESDILIWNNSKFTLKAGEYIIISFLPEGANYTIKEVGPVNVHPKEPGEDMTWDVLDNPYDPEITKPDGDIITKNVITGTVTKNSTQTIHYNNVKWYELPETGGSGTIPYTVAGTTIILLGGAGLMYRKKFRERRA